MLHDTHSVEEKKLVYIPAKTWNSVKKEFDLSEEDMAAFIVTALDKVATEHAQDTNSARVTPEDEENEIEDNLKGLGYL
jgi:phenylalanyl-tRNA synthetase beta subunit